MVWVEGTFKGSCNDQAAQSLIQADISRDGAPSTSLGNLWYWLSLWLLESAGAQLQSVPGPLLSWGPSYELLSGSH